MNAANLLLANTVFLIIILIILVPLLKNGNSKPKVKEDIQKIKKQIFSS